MINRLHIQAEAPVVWAEARCRDRSVAPADLFFSDQISDIARAKTICATCSLVEPCLEGALARQEPCGVWGGELFAKGKILAQKRKRGRPPKHSHEDVQLTA